MRTLPDVVPTAEQLAIFARNTSGVEVIRGAAGSGKTTTALLKLRAVVGLHVARRQRQNSPEPVRALILTFNRTLRGYIEALATQQLPPGAQRVDLRISTFALWATEALGFPLILNSSARQAKLTGLGRGIDLPTAFLLEEVDYVLGRFAPQSVGEYLSAKREGRGALPRVDRDTREAILREVAAPYQAWKTQLGQQDWNDVAIALGDVRITPPYDVIVVDEAQDFSANQVRALRSQLAETHSLVFVVDTAQRIYPRGFTWTECGLQVRPDRVYTLTRNYRNTAEIAAFASPLLIGLTPDPDSSIPNPSACARHGQRPKVLRGRFHGQMSYAARFIRGHVNLNSESVAILHPLGGGWFSHVRETLLNNRLPYVELSREADWPSGPENIGLCTLASAKGLEFDHVFILGLSNETMSEAESVDEEEDERIARLRRLLAMGIGRAKQTVVLGYAPGTASRLMDYLQAGTFDDIDV